MHIPCTEPDYAAISKRVDQEFVCNHEHKTVRRKLAADNSVSIWHQCDRCGHKVGVAIKKASMNPAKVQALPLWDTQLETRFNAQKKKHFDEAYAVEKQRCEDDWDKAYNQYLQTPEWKRKRELVLLRAQGICEGCREAEATVVHHLNYDYVGDEFLFQLVALCRPCHDRCHNPPQQPDAAPTLQSRKTSPKAMADPRQDEDLGHEPLC